MKILWISDSVHIYTGFGTQSHALLKHLAKSHEVLQLGWFCHHDMDYEGIPVKPLGKNFGDIEEIRGYYQEFNPDVVISLGDLQMVDHLAFKLGDYGFRSKWIHWLPVDGEPYPDIFDDEIQNIENIVVLSDFGYNVYKNHVSTGLHKIYHGLDKDIFRPIENRDTLRAREGLHNKFVCLMVAQNQWRKNIPSMIEAFALFARNKHNVELIIHTKPISAAGAAGWNIFDLIGHHKLAGKVKISSESYTPAKMNKLYNCANLLVSSTQGEGFGLPHVEAMMAGVPLLLPDYTTSREQIIPDDDESKRCGELIKIASFTIQSGVNIKRAIIDVNDCCEKMDKYYDDWLHGGALLKRYGRMGRQNAIRRYDLNKITREWDSLIHQIALWQKNSIIQSTDIPVTLKEIL